jgi:hypothetical protein
MINNIDYFLIANSISFYEQYGFEYIDAEWTAPQHIMEITKPGQTVDFRFKDEFLLASGEQYFLNKIYRKELSSGMYMCTTPCFRDDICDDIHGKYFLKTELIIIGYAIGKLCWMVSICKEFFDTIGIETRVVKNEDADHLSYDLRDSNFNIELGSYGIRTHNDIGTWIYGTGLAEPRASYVLKKRAQ